MRSTRIRGLLLFGAILLSTVWVAADSLKAPSPIVTVTGRAAIYHDDLSGARERAVRAGMVRALERYAGLRIEASTLIKKGELIDREVRAHTYGYVRSFEVLDEHRQGNELAVRLRVHVATKPVEESFARAMSATTTLLLVQEHNLGAAVQGRILSAILTDPFFTAKLIVPSDEVLRSAESKVPARFFEEPDPDVARELGLRYLAGIVVVGRAETNKLGTAPDDLGYKVDPSVLRPVVAASGNLTVLDGRSGKLIASKRFEDVRGSDATDPKRAGRKALGSLASQMKDYLVNTLSAYVKDLGYPLRVSVKGSAAGDGAAAVRRVLEDTRWVQKVTVAKEERGKVLLDVVCSENPLYVVEELRQSPSVKVTAFDSAAGTVDLR